MAKPHALQPKPNPTPKHTAHELQRIASNSMHVLNIRDFSHQTPLGLEILSHISSSFSGKVDNIPHPLNWKQLNDVWRAWYEADERLEFNMRNCSAYVNEEEGLANVYMDMDVVGVSNVELKGFSELCWRKEGGKWMIYRFWGSRGMPGNDGFF
ncbi:hypothetical protein M409DRAFT_21896 [Zasmidium cellare ATCC 36951]|uniref:SnoaL-like domain-containing protein n=1 Tax=Zasmidium cellare ATCC 36951 TaxID=1080233 RepID=A0A6A6CKR8_ZASCE|nr:uncharacterized protein M409DRAFT_21896 [Zasmidium cellare ATCC 36951]KAF2167745.1 hypothetical protein M409DRAFT_21896 [Zasmidium cellare ATCC 36951]